jgi:addiction module RelE/StbE family toxin
MIIARSRQFNRQYQKLPIKIQRQFGERLRLFFDDERHPLLHTHALTGEYRGKKSFNVNANIRAVFIIKDEETIYFSAIGSHSELYS